jgi:hypothetical protein
MGKIAEYSISRTKVCFYAMVAGIIIGLFNALVPLIDFTLNIRFFLWLSAALVTVVFLHEGIHGAVAVLSGHRPVFGFKPPLVYVTFTEKIPHGQFILIALAPLVVLDGLFAILFVAGFLKTFSYFCFIINTLGAAGDIWILLKLLPQKKGTLVQDTKTGIEVWTQETEAAPLPASSQDQAKEPTVQMKP